MFIVSKASDDAKRLLDDLLANYNNIVRPVIHPDDQIKLYLGIKLSQIADIVRKTINIIVVFSSCSTMGIYFFKGWEESDNDNKCMGETCKKTNIL